MLRKRCDGCGTNIPSNSSHTTYSLYDSMNPNTDKPYLYFCKNCTDHINNGGAMFFRTYSFNVNPNNF